MNNFSMTWVNGRSQLDHGSMLPDRWESNNLMKLIEIAKDNNLIGHVYITEWDNEEIDNYGLGNILNQVDMYEILDFMKEKELDSLLDLSII